MSDTNEPLLLRYVRFYGGTITFGQIVKTPTQASPGGSRCTSCEVCSQARTNL
jgi:hypothetical protein